ncbi:ladderlectin-like [Enoplosus armatus]|uniref:ladderlectin-like n=1 Tax=Enoplosus armatus TaxID=215367 RepID=UPI003995C2BE
MKTLLILSVILCVALSIRAAAVGSAAAAAVQQEDKPAAKPAPLNFCLDGWNSFRGNCYYLGNFGVSWSTAESYCAEFGGSLASANDIVEYNFLQRTVKTGGHRFAWIGGYYFQDQWRWEDGSVFGYHNWDTVSSNSGFQCLQLNSEVLKGWSNQACSSLLPFVCELKSNC